MNPDPEEQHVRALRDAVYGQPSGDKNWDACREHWLRPDSVRWLREKTKEAMP